MKVYLLSSSESDPASSLKDSETFRRFFLQPLLDPSTSPSGELRLAFGEDLVMLAKT